MKKKAVIISIILVVCASLLIYFCFIKPSCSNNCSNSSKKVYQFTHSNGVTSKFKVNFDKNTWNYEGICIWQTIRLGANYGKGNVGMTEKCSGTMKITDSYDDGCFYEFTSTNADVNWQITVYVTADKSYLNCFIASSSGYYFNLK